MDDHTMLRLWQIVGCSRRNVPALIPISKSTFYNHIKTGRVPAATSYYGTGLSAWRWGDIKKAYVILEPI